jgi:uncharacterized protein YceK
MVKPLRICIIIKKGVEMSTIKKLYLITVVITAVVCLALMAGCGEALSSEKAKEGAETNAEQSKDTEAVAKETAAEAKETAAEAKISGEIYENAKFSMTIPDGWIISYKTENSVWLNTGDEVYGMIIEISGSNITESVIKAEAEELIKNKNGSPLEEVTALGIKFFKTNVVDGTLDQTAYLSVRNGEKVAIILAGKGHQDNAEMKAMMESIKFK